MALIYDNMPCSICGNPIKPGDTYVATSHFIGDSKDPLFRFSDSAMHETCFTSWPLRETFLSKYRATLGSTHAQIGKAIMSPPAEDAPPPPPKHTCPQCGHGLPRPTKNECPSCGWLKYPSDRARWSTSGPCPHCRFSYRWDGNTCSHCGHHAEDAPTPTPPPPTLDNAHVLWWAWSGDIPFVEIQGAECDDRWVHGLAICRYDNGQIYRFSCNKNWEVIQDAPYQTEDQAKTFLPTNYQPHRIHWLRYMPTP